MAMMKHKVVVTLKLPQLQNFIKRDPESYREEFMMQFKHYESELDIFKLRPTNNSQRFTDLITFMSHVAPCYKQECLKLPLQMMDLMESNASALHPEVRFKLFQCLVQLHNKEMIDSVTILKLAFKLFSVQDKALRIAVADFIINDIKTLNKNKNNEKVNKRVQALLFDILAEDTTIAARKTIYILSELYRRKIWTDARTVNVIATACKSSSTRVMVAALNFFLGIENKMHEDEEEETKSHSMGAKMVKVNYHEHSKKTKAKARKIKSQKHAAKKSERLHEKSKEEATPLFPAIQLIHDPQSLAEDLFKQLRKSCERFEVKLLLMNLISRLIGCHELILLPFYSFLQRYLTSHQQEITRILTYLIQACHALVPPEDMTPVVKAIAFHFISERSSDEVLAVGLNSLREIFRRIPSLLREEGMGDFVADLAQYSRKSHKSVMMAAHGVVNLVRELYPTLLHKSHRGKFYDVNHFPTAYGAVVASEGVEGAHLLEAYERGEVGVDSDGEVYYEEDRLKDVYGNDILVEEEEESDEEEPPELVDLREVPCCDHLGGDGDEDDEEEDEGDEDDEDEEDEEEQWQEVEEDGDDEGEEDVEDSDEWEEVEGSEDEEVEGSVDSEENSQKDAKSKSKPKAVTFEAVEKAKASRRNSANTGTRIDSQRLLSAEDFELLEKLKAAQRERERDPKFRSKRKHEQLLGGDDDSDQELGYSLDTAAIAPARKTQKSTKIERIQRILEGRKENRFVHEGHGGGLTNKEKARTKNYLMVRKGKASVSQKGRKKNSVARDKLSHHREAKGRERRKRRRT